MAATAPSPEGMPSAAEAATGGAPSAVLSREQLVKLRDNADRLEDASILQAHATARLLDQRAELRSARTRMLYLFVAGVTVTVSFNLSSISKRYPRAFAWYDVANPRGFHDPRYPFPDGPFARVRLRDVAITSDFGALSVLLSLTFQMKSVPLAGARFLMLMAERYCALRELVGMHWAGSARQLGLQNMDVFVPTDPRLDEEGRWAAWSHPSNHWFRLYPTPAAFFGSAVVNDYVSGRNPHWLRGLYTGGLMHIAMYLTDGYDDGPSLVRRLMGSRAIDGAPAPRCEPYTRAQAGMYGAMMAMPVAMIGSMFLGGRIPPNRIVGGVAAITAGYGAFEAATACPDDGGGGDGDGGGGDGGEGDGGEGGGGGEGDGEAS